MGATSVSGRRRERGAGRVGTRASPPRRTLAPADAAWAALIPCALLALAAILLLAPPLGGVLFPVRRIDFWPSLAGDVAREPAEQTAFLLALGAVVLLSGAVLASTRRPLSLPARVSRLAVGGGQWALCAVLLAALAAQRLDRYEATYTLGPTLRYVYFTWPTLAFAAALAASVPLLLRTEATRRRLAELLRETRARRRVAIALAASFAAAWLLTAINVDASVGNVNPAVRDMMPWSFDETYAILDGRAPLLDFHAQYGQLWPYLAALALAIVGSGMGAWTGVMAAIGGAALLAVFALLRRVTRSSLAALALFAPFVATSFFMERGPLENRYGPANLYTIFPVRYAGPYLLAWLLARRLDGRRPRRDAVVFLCAGLVVLNNPEFGIPALGATIAAYLWAVPPRTPRAAARLAGAAAAGLLGALALVALLTFARSGALPRFGLLFEFARLYGVSGWGMLPMKPLGLHLVVFATFAAAATLATVRTVNRDPDVVFTGMLGWSGIFGLGAGAYFVGRSHPDVLVNLFSAWALALSLLAVAAVRALAARPSRRPHAVELAVLVGFGLAVASLAQTPAPWSQLERLADDTPTAVFRDNAYTHFLAAHTRRGERVAILNAGGHRYAYDLGLDNVSPYASSLAIVTVHQLRTTVDALRAAGGRKLFVALPATDPAAIAYLQRHGFAVARVEQTTQELELIDRAER